MKPNIKNAFNPLLDLPLLDAFLMNISKAIRNKAVASKLKILIVESGCFNDGTKFVEKAIRYEHKSKINNFNFILLPPSVLI